MLYGLSIAGQNKHWCCPSLRPSVRPAVWARKCKMEDHRNLELGENIPLTRDTPLLGKKGDWIFDSARRQPWSPQRRCWQWVVLLRLRGFTTQLYRAKLMLGFSKACNGKWRLLCYSHRT